MEERVKLLTSMQKKVKELQKAMKQSKKGKVLYNIPYT